MRTLDLHGAQMPVLGLGTWKLAPAAARDMVREALAMGYRHIDTARMYGNEEGVGEGLKQSNVARGDIFLTTKIWSDDYRAEAFDAALADSLRNLRTTYVDLVLLHWPSADIPLDETIAAMNRAREAGKVRHIGVSNFTTDLLNTAVSLSEAPLLTNQVEYHPFLNQDPVYEALRANDMILTAYSPLAQGNVVGNPTIKAIADRHGKTEAQITLAWLLGHPFLATIPKSSKPTRARENLEALEIALTDEERADIGALRSNNGRLVDPAWAPDWDIAA